MLSTLSCIVLHERFYINKVNYYYYYYYNESIPLILLTSSGGKLLQLKCQVEYHGVTWSAREYDGE